MMADVVGGDLQRHKMGTMRANAVKDLATVEDSLHVSRVKGHVLQK